MELYLKNKQLKTVDDLLSNAEDSQKEMDIEKFKKALSEVDSQMKFLPATAQVICFISKTMSYT